MKYLLIVSLFFLLYSQPLFSTEEKPNHVMVCENGLEMFHWDLDFIRSAEKSIEVLACFFGGDIAQELLETIGQRLSEVPDLQVYLLASPVLVEPKDWDLLYALQKAYPYSFHFEFSSQITCLAPDLLTIDNHVKLLVVDETYFSAGGTNLEERHCSEGTSAPTKEPRESTEAQALLPVGMRDQDVVGKGPLAREFRKIFYQLYSLWENYNSTMSLELDPEHPKNKSRFFEIVASPYVKRFENSQRLREIPQNQMKVLLGGPHQDDNLITQEYVRLIQEAKKEIIIEHLYFFPIPCILDALLDAVNRGVKLTLITNGLDDSTVNATRLFCWGNRMSYVPIFYGSHFHFWEAYSAANQPLKQTEIFEYLVPRVWLHKKVMIVDREILVVGSYNLGMKSAYGDYEIILEIQSKEAAQDAFLNFQKDLSLSHKISPELARKWYFDPFISYLGLLQKKFSGFL